MSLTALLKRVAQCLVLIVLALTVIFVLVRLVPGDPAQIMLPDFAPDSVVADLRATLGLDQPLLVQYARALGRAAVGDFGRSFLQQRPALGIVLEALPTTLILLAGAFGLALVVSVPLGTVTAVTRGSALERLSLPLLLLGQSMPTYWVGILLIYLFAVRLGLLPTSGHGGIRYYILPSLSLAIWLIALLASVTKARVEEAASEPHVTVAHAKGLGRATVLRRHVLPLASIEIATVAGVEAGFLLGGAVITESIFALPGIGSVGLRAIAGRDYPVVQAVVVCVVVLLAALNLLLDLLYAYLDPRIRVA